MQIMTAESKEVRPHEVQPAEPDAMKFVDPRYGVTLPIGSIVTLFVIVTIIMLLIRWSKSR